MRKQPKDNDERHEDPWRKEEKLETTSTHSDVERKREEMKNSTIGGF